MTDIFTKSEHSRIMAAVKSKDTTPELLVRRLVHSLGYRYRLHVRSLPGCSGYGFSPSAENHQCQRLFLAFAQMSKVPCSIEQAQILDCKTATQCKKR